MGPAADARNEFILGNTVSVPSTYRGTLGMLCIDKQDGKVVGLTNNHVAGNVYRSSDWDQLDEAYRRPVNVDSSGIKGTSMQGVGAPGDVYQAKQWFVQPSIGDEPAGFNSYVGEAPGGEPPRQMGVLKRAYPWATGDANLIDASIVTIENPYRFAQTVSFNILGHPHRLSSPEDAFTFATTEELDLMDGSEQVVKCGATFGAVGVDGVTCRLGVHSVSSTSTVSKSWGTQSYVDVIVVTGTVDPSAGGDSGAVYTARFTDEYGGNKWKIIGLHFAGGELRIDGVGYDIGVGCRIDHVAELLDIEPFDGNNADSYSVTFGEEAYIFPPFTAGEASFPYEQKYLTVKNRKSNKHIYAAGKKFTQAGLDDASF